MGTIVVDYIVDLFFIVDAILLLLLRVDTFTSIPAISSCFQIRQSTNIVSPEGIRKVSNGNINNDSHYPEDVDAVTLLLKNYHTFEIEGATSEITLSNILSTSIDALSLLPIEVLAYANGNVNYQIYRGLKLLRTRHFNLYWEEFRDTFTYYTKIDSPSLLRFFYVATILAIMAHLGACAMYKIGIDSIMQGETISWLISDQLVVRNSSDNSIQILHSVGYRYLRAIYWSVQHLDTVGFGDVCARNEPETWFTIFFFIVTALTLYYNTASMMTVLTTVDATRAEMVVKKARFAKYASYRNLPRHINVKIDNYFEYQYEKLKGVEDQVVNKSG